MESSQRRGRMHLSTTWDSEEEMIEELAEIIQEHAQRDQSSEDMDSFDEYTQNMKGHLYRNVHEFRSRFKKGYQALVEEIEKEE